ILIFQDFNPRDLNFAKEFVEHFWQPLAAKAAQVPCVSSDYKLLMFLIDNRGGVATCPFDVADGLDNGWEPRVLVKLPKLASILGDELVSWIIDEGHKLPLKIRVEDILKNNEDGIPEMILEDVCELCGCNWAERAQL